MTSAQRELRTGSFRGVSFETSSTTLTVGRRTQVFEYPQRDTPFVEDLGKKCREIKFKAFVTGSDYIAKMNRLIQALEKGGSGELVHPWLGTMLVVPQASNNVSYNNSLRVASIDLVFVESGESKYPSSEKDKGFFSRSFADLVKNEAINDFVNNFNLDGVQDFVSASVAGDLSEFLELEELQTVSKLFGVSDALADITSDALSLVSKDPRVLANTLANSLGLSGFTNSVNNWRRVTRQLSRLTSSEKLATVSKKDFVSNTTTKLVAQNSDALQTLIRQVSISNVIGASTIVGTSLDQSDGKESKQVMSYDDMIDVRNEIIQSIDIEMERCGSDSVYLALEKARSSVWADMTERADDNARLIEFTPPEVMPAVVLAYEYYGDADRDREIVERNNIRHGGFVPASPLKLLSK